MTDLRQAAQAVIDHWDSPLWKNGSTADAIADLRTALEQQAEPVSNQTGETNGRHDEFRSDLYGTMAVGRDTSRAVYGEKPASLTGHCKEKTKPGGCQLHNLQCGYPACDKPVITPQQQAEPVAFVNADNLQGLTLGHYGYVEIYTYESAGSVPLYTAPPQRKPLTVKEINALPEAKGYWPIGMNDRIVRLIRAVEAAHNIKEGT